MSIFISYRRDETKHIAGRLYERLKNTFGEDRVFRDVYSIPGGEDFPTWIKEKVSAAEVVVALIGDRWATIGDERHPRRLDDPEDWVRLEIATALEQDTLVIPVLVDGARMPGAGELPDPLKNLRRHQTVHLWDRSFDADADGLIRLLRRRVPGFGSATVEGEFRVPGTFHVHVDGDDQPYIESLLGRLKPEFPSKPLTRVLGSVKGPQRKDDHFDASYRYHTPGSGEGEGFSVFSTTLLGTGTNLAPDAIETLKELIDGVTRKKGLVLEFERVVATIDEEGNWNDKEVIADPQDLWEMARECVYPRLTTSPIEIHHAIDIPKRGSSEPPLDLKDLPVGPNVGGWALFEKKHVWAYRSKQFAEWTDYEIYAKDGDTRLREFAAHLQQAGVEATIRTVVEQVLGIWRKTDESVPKDFKSVPDLARWEMECPEFWVVAANFLGDKSPDVKNAMVQNLKKRVTYTYFVRSYADVFRLNMLRNELVDALSDRMTHQAAQGIVRNQIRCVLLRGIRSSELNELLEPDYFICPRSSDEREVEGYQMIRGAIGGRKLEEGQVNAIIQGLSPLLQQEIEGFFYSLPQEPWRPFDNPKKYAIVCTDLDSAGVTGGSKEWEEALALYDQIVARQISIFPRGDVVRPVRNGYLLVFESVKDATDFAKRLESSMDWHNQQSRRTGRGERLPSQTIALEFGSATRVLRAHGDDYIGRAVEACISQLDVCKQAKIDAPGGLIGVSERFASIYKDDYGEEPFPGRTTGAKHEWTILT